jgi:hypothetical protein
MVQEDGQILTGRAVDDSDTRNALTFSAIPQADIEPWLPGPPYPLGTHTRGELEALHYHEDIDYYKEPGWQTLGSKLKLGGLASLGRTPAERREGFHTFRSDGRGQMTLQNAHMVGAEVFATVGYDSKRKLLIDEYSIPADHIFYSRDSSFV